jgi:hypothetical protein
VWILIKDVEKDSFVLDRSYRHIGHHTTMEASLDDAAYEAYLGLRSQRFNAMLMMFNAISLVHILN